MISFVRSSKSLIHLQNQICVYPDSSDLNLLFKFIFKCSGDLFLGLAKIADRSSVSSLLFFPKIKVAVSRSKIPLKRGQWVRQSHVDVVSSSPVLCSMAAPSEPKSCSVLEIRRVETLAQHVSQLDRCFGPHVRRTSIIASSTSICRSVLCYWRRTTV